MILFFGIQFALNFVGKDYATNTFFVGIIKTVGFGVSDLIFARTNRKIWLLICNTIASLTLIAYIFIKIPDDCGVDKTHKSCYQLTL